MTVELVDGHAGSKHIESRDIAILHQGWRNIGNCVFPGYGGTPFQISFSGNNVQIGPGAASIQGLDFYNDGTESLSIPNAASYGTRVVGAEYTNDGGIESVELKVYSSESEMPRSGSITSGSTVFAMPLWNVTGSSGSWSSSRRYSLLNLGGGSGAGAEDVSGKFSVVGYGWAVYWMAVKSGGMVTLSLRAQKTTADWNTYKNDQKTEILRFSSELAPSWNDFHFPAATTWDSTVSRYEWNVNNDKDSQFANEVCIRVMGPSGTKVASGTTVSGSFSWGLKAYGG